MKYVIRIVVVIALCATIWFVHPAREQVKELEKDLSYQYASANSLLRNTTEELLRWDFRQPVAAEDEEYIHGLFFEVTYITDLLFDGHVVHSEWKNRLEDIQIYLKRYLLGPELSEEEVADLQQALQANLFISMDFLDVTQPDYGAMHDEQHEMVKKIINRLNMHYFFP